LDLLFVYIQNHESELTKIDVISAIAGLTKSSAINTRTTRIRIYCDNGARWHLVDPADPARGFTDGINPGSLDAEDSGCETVAHTTAETLTFQAGVNGNDGVTYSIVDICDEGILPHHVSNHPPQIEIMFGIIFQRNLLDAWLASPERTRFFDNPINNGESDMDFARLPLSFTLAHEVSNSNPAYTFSLTGVWCSLVHAYRHWRNSK
jgi:hypothetical protein